MMTMRRVLMLLLLLVVSARAAFAQNDYTTTANLALKKPKVGSTNFGVYINGDFDTIDAAVGQFHGGFVIVPASATPIFDLTKGNTFQLTMTANVTSSTVNQPSVTAGQFLYLLICQDGTGSRTFTFPASFQTPLPTISPTPNKCSASTWVWSASFSAWINTGGSGGGGGGSAAPAPPAFAIQKADAAALNLAASSILDNGTTVTVSEPVSLSSTLGVTGAITGTSATLSGLLTANATVASNAFVSTSANPATIGAIRLSNADIVRWRNAANNSDNISIGPTAASGQIPADALSFPMGIGTSFLMDTNAVTSATGFIRMPSSDTICWRNAANSGDVCLSKDSSNGLSFRSGYLELGSTGLVLDGATSGITTLIATAIAGATTATLPANTGPIAELNLAQTWTANQSVANGTELRFFSTNATNYAGFKGGASVVNLVWLFPSTDSSGTQCLSSNGSLQLAWSACSAGTGTPGGASTNIQYNNAGAFAGSGNFTFNGTDTVTLGLLNTTKGIWKQTGNTSGTVTVQPQAVAGTPTITWPTTSGTVATTGAAPVAVDVTTGVVACATCDNSAATLTANQLVVGAGTHATAALGTLGTTTTVLHGNAGGLPTFAAVNMATETTGTLAITNGGTGGTTLTAAFDNLSPTTTRGDLIVRGASNNVRLAIGANGLCIISNGTDPAWGSCASGAVSGNATSGQGTFWNGTASVGGSVNWLYSAATGHSVIQGANNVDALYMKRFTDTSPTGNFIHLQNAAANADVFKVDVSGNATMQTATFTGAGAGGIQMNQGAAPALATNAINLAAPASVAASGENFIFPGNPSSGFIRWTNSSGTLTGAFASASGIGNCGANQVVQQVNDNAAPSCTSLTAAMFTSQGANTFLAAPSGSTGIPTFRVPVSADIPPIQLNSAANGGVTNILPILNGGTNASTAAGAFNNLSPMTTAGDVIYGGSSGTGTRLAAGSATQLLHSGTTPSWSAVSLTADVSGVLPLANGGTNASSGLTNTNGVVYSDGTKLVSTATGGAGTLCLTSTAGGTPVFGSCSGGASTSWSNLTAPGADLSLSMSTFNTLFTHGIMVGTRNIMEWTDGASTSTGSVLNVHTNASSTMKPFTFTAAGTANGIQMDNTGSVGVIGTGHLTADKLSRTITTTAPLTIGGGSSADLTADRTIACAICVTSASSLTNGGIVIGSGGGQGVVSSANIILSGGGLFTTMGGTVTAGVGTPFIIGVSNVTAQSTSQGAVTIATAPTAGSYLIRYYASQNAVCTTGANTVSFTFNWTDAGNARVLTTGSLALSTAQATSGYLSGLMPIFVNSGNVTYTSTVAGACGSGTSSYDIHASIERMQ